VQTSLFQRAEAAVETDRREFLSRCSEFADMGGFGIAYAPLLVETYHYVSFSARLLGKAISRIPVTRHAIQHYLSEHLAEEVGHERWALADLQRLGISEEAVIRTSPLEPTQRLVANQLFMIEFVSPMSILGYIYAMESTPPNEDILTDIEKALDLPARCMTFLKGHSEKDATHREEIQDLLDSEKYGDAEADAIVRSAVLAYRDLGSLFSDICAGRFDRDISETAA
jgi:pyrroloquinoline quinone (PQQ) biosynthesis protein C